MRTVVVFLLLLSLAVAGLALLSRNYGRWQVEQALQETARERLDRVGLEGVNVRFDHLDAHLAGQVATDEESARARAVVGGISGARLFLRNDRVAVRRAPITAEPLRPSLVEP